MLCWDVVITVCLSCVTGLLHVWLSRCTPLPVRPSWPKPDQSGHHVSATHPSAAPDMGNDIDSEHELAQKTTKHIPQHEWQNKCLKFEVVWGSILWNYFMSRNCDLMEFVVWNARTRLHLPGLKYRCKNVKRHCTAPLYAISIETIVEQTNM